MVTGNTSQRNWSVVLSQTSVASACVKPRELCRLEIVLKIIIIIAVPQCIRKVTSHESQSGSSKFNLRGSHFSATEATYKVSQNMGNFVALTRTFKELHISQSQYKAYLYSRVYIFTF